MNNSKTNRVRFITAAYGENYVGLLLTNIYSIITSNPHGQITVIWEDIETPKIDLLKKAFPKVEFIKSCFNFGDNFIKRISSKTKIWELVARKYIDQYICFIDSDTLVLKDITHFFDDEFDIAFTYKDEQFPLNTGVILVKNTHKTLLFFKLWRENTCQILNSRDTLKIANSLEYPYGAADQMALYNILHYKKGVDRYAVSISNNQLMFKGIPCSILNETNSRPISNKHHVIHYKGGWRPILRDGFNFTKNRTKKDSFEMYILYLKTYLKAVELLKKYDTGISYKDFKIKIPFYLNLKTLEENKILYDIHSVFKKIAYFKFFFLYIVKKIINKIVKKIVNKDEN